MELITEFEFELPRGYVDENGEVHKKGVDVYKRQISDTGYVIR